ncbi:MAG: CoA-transferase [Nakamurella sp.]
MSPASTVIRPTVLSLKTIDAADAVARIPDGVTVLVDGSGGGVNEPGAVLTALEQRFLATGHPNALTIVHISGMGDGNGSGIDRFAHPGMVARVIGGHWGWTQAMQRMAGEEQFAAYCLPQGTLSHLLREIASHRPGVISTVGLGTSVDPRNGGGRLNKSAVADVNRLLELDGKIYIFTPSFPIDVSIVRGTYADTRGNISMDEEGLFAETLAAAQAARNSGGIVIAQVRDVVDAHGLDPRRVRIPGILVDAVVADPEQRLSVATHDSIYLTGRGRAPVGAAASMPLTERKVIARRAALQLQAGDIINLGFGMPDGVAAVLTEEGLSEAVTFTVEQGHVGGTPAGGSDFGMCINPDASLDAGAQFDFYDGGGLDIAVLSFAQLDAAGNVNVGQFGGRIPGVGGFINISQGAKRVVFVGTLVAGRGYAVGVEATGDPTKPLTVPTEGKHKLVAKVEQISFSAAQALADGKPATYVTERAVFQLTLDGLQLTEVAPGLDVERDVLAYMDFRPKIAESVATMDLRCFNAESMHLELPTRRGEE